MEYNVSIIHIIDIYYKTVISVNQLLPNIQALSCPRLKKKRI